MARGSQVIYDDGDVEPNVPRNLVILQNQTSYRWAHAHTCLGYCQTNSRLRRYSLGQTVDVFTDDGWVNGRVSARARHDPNVTKCSVQILPETETCVLVV